MQLCDVDAVEAQVRRAVDEVVITDVHTHLFPPSHGRLLLWGVDELLTYHYLVAELFKVAPADLTPRKFYNLPKHRQADCIWQHLFLGAGPLSEACRGVITTLSTLGLDVASRDLSAIRKWFDQQKIDQYMPRVFELAGIDYAVMTNDPFKADQARHWLAGEPAPQCLKPALRIDAMILDWPAAQRTMSQAGYQCDGQDQARSFAEARRFLLDWAERIEPVYLAASLEADFAYPSEATGSAVLREVIVPAAIELGVPVALMIGVRRGVNPDLGDAGDGVGVADVAAVQHLCRQFPQAKFIVCMLSRVNQHELCVLARKFSNLHVEGCWWFCNNPSIIEEITRMRLELLGTSFTAQHSDARVLDQLVYKWAHTRKIVADVLAEKYADLLAAGWRPTAEEIRRDVRAIFGGSFEAFLAR